MITFFLHVTDAGREIIFAYPDATSLPTLRVQRTDDAEFTFTKKVRSCDGDYKPTMVTPRGEGWVFDEDLGHSTRWRRPAKHFKLVKS